MHILLSDEEPTPQADVVLKIDYDANSGSAARAFEIAAELIRSLEDFDRVAGQTIHLSLETSLIVESIEKSSIKIFLKNVIKQIPDEALKDVDVKKLIGHFLVKAKYAAIKWLDESEQTRKPLKDLTEEIAAIARESDVRRLPDYPAPNPTRISQSLDRFQETKKKFLKGEGLTITLGQDEYSVDLDSQWLASGAISEEDEDEKQLVNEHDIILVIGKADFLGNSKWTFRHGKQPYSLKIEDVDWLSDFKSGKYPIKSGDALKVRLRVEHRYDLKGELIEANQSIIKVFDVIERPEGNGELFDD